MKRILFCNLALLASASVAAAAWPARVFAPYAYLGDDKKIDINACQKSCGQPWYVLAFIVSGKDGGPVWDGYRPLNDDRLDATLAELRKAGGDVAVSFGGEAGTELALSHKDVDSLTATYTQVVDSHHFTWLDFDIEGKTLDDAEANHRRNAAIVKLQASHPGLFVSFTLPGDPDGIPAAGLKLLADAKAAGVVVGRVDVMTMDFGPHYSAGKKLSDVCIATAVKSHEQCDAIDPRWTLGLCALIGRGDVKSEFFSTDDADRLFAWSQAMPWVSGLSFWSSNIDTKTPGWVYTNKFKPLH